MFESRDPGKDTQLQFWIDARKLPEASAISAALTKMRH